MMTKPMPQFIRPPDTLDIGDDVEKFLELTKTSEKHRGLFIKAFLLRGSTVITLINYVTFKMLSLSGGF